jgi:hypothetical protein
MRVNAAVRLRASALCAVAAITVTATAIFAQSSGIRDQEKQRAARLLLSPAWTDRAWGAYFAGRLHTDELNEQLMEQLRIATALRDMPSYSEEHAFTAVLFDSLIESGTSVPARMLEPFAQGWTAPVLILTARTKDSEDLLLRFGGEKSRDDVWLAANNLLSERKSQRWYDMIWREISIRHRFHVTDTGDRTIYGGGGGGGEAICGDGVLAMPKGFPPVTIYSLRDAASPGAVVLATGPQDVYYSRTIAPTDKQVGFGSCVSQVNREAIRFGYLACLRNASTHDIERLFRSETNIQYTTREDFIQQIDDRMKAQEDELRQLALEIEDHGLHAPEMQLRIEPEVQDHRQTRDGSLPLPPPKEIHLR